MILDILTWMQLVTALVLLGFTVWMLKDSYGDWKAVQQDHFKGSPVYQQAGGALHLASWRVFAAGLLAVLGILLLNITRDETPGVAFLQSLAIRTSILLITGIEVAKVATDYFTRTHVLNTISSSSGYQFVASQVLELLPDSLIIINRRGFIKLTNAECERLFGYTKQELAGRKLDTLLEHDFTQVIQPVDIDFVKAKHKDGSDVTIEVNACPFPTSYAKHVLIVGRKGSKV